MQTPSLVLLGKKIAFSTMVQYAGKMLQLVFSMINLKLIAGFLSGHDYGTYAAIAEYTLFFSTAANLGIFGNVVKKMADNPSDGKIFINALALRIVTALTFFVTAIFVLSITGADRMFIFGSILYFGSLFFDNIKSVCDGMLQSNYMMGRSTFSLIAGKLIQCVGVFMVVRYFSGGTTTGNGVFDLSLLFLPFLFGSVVSVGLAMHFVREKIVWNFRPDKKMMVNFLLASLPFGIINIFNNLYFRFIPDYLANSSLTGIQFGSFSVSFRIAQIVSLASTFLMYSVLPGFKQSLDEGHFEKAKKLYSSIKKIILLAGILLFAGGTIVSSLMLEILAHKKYILPELWFVMPMMLFLAAVSYGYDLILITLFAMEKEIWLLKRELGALALAAVFFAMVFATQDPIAKTWLIMAGAIAGESFMVISGLGKIRKMFGEAGKKDIEISQAIS